MIDVSDHSRLATSSRSRTSQVLFSAAGPPQCDAHFSEIDAAVDVSAGMLDP